MAGHNKWSKIKHKKAKEDAKRGKRFTRFARDIEIAARAGGEDPQYNAALRTAIDRAKAENMSNDLIDRAIKRGAGLIPGQIIEEIVYEGYGPHGIAVMIECLSDNRNRTVGEVRNVFTKADCSLGETGSVSWMFERVGLIQLANAKQSEEAMMDAAIMAGANDVAAGDDPGSWEIYTGAKELAEVQSALLTAKFSITEARLIYQAKNLTDVAGQDAESVLKFIQKLEDLDDVQEVYSNASISDNDLERLADLV